MKENLMHQLQPVPLPQMDPETLPAAELAMFQIVLLHKRSEEVFATRKSLCFLKPTDYKADPFETFARGLIK